VEYQNVHLSILVRINQMNLFNKYFRRLHPEAGTRLLGPSGPALDWKIIFFLSLTLSLVVVVLGIYLFHRVNNYSTSSSDERMEKGAGILNITLLEEVINRYNIRKSEFEETVNSPIPYRDPSL
jgi:hypothetical protein